MTHVPPALEILEPVCQAQNVKEEEDLYQVKTIHLKIQKVCNEFYSFRNLCKWFWFMLSHVFEYLWWNCEPKLYLHSVKLFFFIKDPFEVTLKAQFLETLATLLPTRQQELALSTYKRLVQMFVR